MSEPWLDEPWLDFVFLLFLRFANSMPSTTSNMATSALRRIPPVNDLLAAEELQPLAERLPQSMMVDVIRDVLDDARAGIVNGADHPIDVASLARSVAGRLEAQFAPAFTPVINATGIILHTGLGRAPLAEEAISALVTAAATYVPLELELATGERGGRARKACELVCALTGAEAACIVNNNAAALVLALAATSGGREVIVSRGELIEIGGGFRLPEIMQAAGVTLVEVGTTNRTRRNDFQRAVSSRTAALLKVHPSNYRMAGFTEQVATDELAEIANEH
jgi:L-seryl-tRNA(Ser) seleniumtransferase